MSDDTKGVPREHSGETTIDSGTVTPAQRKSRRQAKPKDGLRKAVTIYDRLLYDNRVSHPAKSLWKILKDHSCNKDRLCCVGFRRLADDLNCDKTSVPRWLDELKAAGWVKWTAEKTYHEATDEEPAHTRKKHIYVLLDGTSKLAAKSSQRLTVKYSQKDRAENPVKLTVKHRPSPPPCPLDKGEGDRLSSLGDTVAVGSGLASAGLAPAEQPALSVDPSEAPDFIRTKF